LSITAKSLFQTQPSFYAIVGDTVANIVARAAAIAVVAALPDVTASGLGVGKPIIGASLAIGAFRN
jgi:hypothetical protein